MKFSAMLACCVATTGLAAMADTSQPAGKPEPVVTLYSEQSIETPTLSIDLAPLDDDLRFSISLRDKRTGFAQHHAFDGQAASDPAPYQFEQMYFCDTQVILLTIRYPWRHALPQYRRVLETYAFRMPDFAFIDMAFGPLTDIALQDSNSTEDMDPTMLAPVGVQCQTDAGRQPFRFAREAD